MEKFGIDLLLCLFHQFLSSLFSIMDFEDPFFMISCACFILFGVQVLKFLMEKNSISTLHGQVTIGTLILQVYYC